jgi:hypothetical protein
MYWSCKSIDNKSEDFSLVILIQYALAADVGWTWISAYRRELATMECEDTHASMRSTYKSDAPPV